jgi:hypothetical protein
MRSRIARGHRRAVGDRSRMAAEKPLFGGLDARDAFGLG